MRKWQKAKKKVDWAESKIIRLFFFFPGGDTGRNESSKEERLLPAHPFTNHPRMKPWVWVVVGCWFLLVV